jgi:hypothetical protein
MLEVIGDIGFLLSAAMLILFSLLYLICVRWWTDILGRLIASVLIIIFTIMTLASIRILDVPLPGVQWWRAGLYGGLGVSMTAANAVFVWSQFIAPRVKRSTNERKSQ